MNKIIVEPKDKDELESLQGYLKQNGILFTTEEKYRLQNQKQRMQEFADLLSQSPDAGISEQEIDSIVEEVRVQRYEANRS